MAADPRFSPNPNPPLPPRPKNSTSNIRRNSATPGLAGAPPTPPKRNLLHSSLTSGDFSTHLTGSHHSSFSTPSLHHLTNPSGGDQYPYSPPHSGTPHSGTPHSGTPSSTYHGQGHGQTPAHYNSYRGTPDSHSGYPTPSPSSGYSSGNPPPPVPGRRPMPNHQQQQQQQQQSPHGRLSAGARVVPSSLQQQQQQQQQQFVGDTYVSPDAIAEIREMHWRAGGSAPTTTQQHGSSSSGSLEEQDWYWGNVSKEEVTEIMKDKPNGAFLVRNAARVPGYYTLTLRKGGVNRLIRIMFRDGLYGFAEPLEFRSVIELVDYYKENSLAPYSPKLDITLGGPISRKQVQDDMVDRLAWSEEEIISRLRVLEEELRVKGREYTKQKQKFEGGNEDIKNMRIQIAAQHEIISIFSDSLKEHSKHHNSCPLSLKPILDENFRLLERTCRMNRDTHKDLEEKLIRMERTKNCIDTELNSLKPEIKQMQAERGKLYRVLNQRGMSNHDVVSAIKNSEGGDGEEEEEEGLYATYAMLHTIRKEADYQRISEELRKRARRPPPLPSDDFRNSPSGRPVVPPSSGGPPSGGPPSAGLPRVSPHQDSLPPRSRISTIAERPPPRQLSTSESFEGQLIGIAQLNNLPPSLPHRNERAWMNPSITREGSRDLLVGKENGTFLVRPKMGVEESVLTSPTHSHTIDIIDRGKFKRIPVFKDPGGGYGFAPPYEFDSLRTLVLYYATNTMEKHNPDLETTLMYPAFHKY